jgi:triosephosphate isomerase
MKTPVVAINFKTYASSTGTSAQILAKLCEETAQKTQKNVFICVSATDVHIAKELSIPVYAQHVDGVSYGAHTGDILPGDLAQYQIAGSLINHSEDQYQIEDIKKAIDACKVAKITSIVCAGSLDIAKQVAEFTPDCIAYEPPDLIGGDVSVTTRPEIVSQVKDAIQAINPSIKILVGAGVKNADDVKKALELGTDGVLLASAITKAEDPQKVLEELVQPL